MENFNFSNFQSLELFKEQLTVYLSHLSNEKHHDSLNKSVSDEAQSITQRIKVASDPEE